MEWYDVDGERAIALVLLANTGADGRLGASEFAGDGSGRTGKRTMYDAWPWGFSPRFGAVYNMNSETVARLSAARTFGSLKNTGGSSHWNGFIGGYNVTAPALPASSAFNWDQGWPTWPEPPFLVPQTLNGSNIPYWLLLAIQILILAVMIYVSLRVQSGQLSPNPRAGKTLAWLGALYFAGSLARIVAGLAIPSAAPWFRTWIPAFFHVVLATYVLTIAHYHLRAR